MASGGFGFRVTIDDGAVLAALRDARREIGQDVRRELLEVAERVALPIVRGHVPGRWGRSVIVKASTRNAFLTTSLRGMQRRTFGMLNFGGISRSPIRPRRAKALAVGPGIIRASVTRPRKYAARHWIEKGAQAARGRFQAEMAERVEKILRDRIEGAGGAF